MWFRKLNKKEELQFRLWARENYQPFTQIDELWHPVVREECLQMNVEQRTAMKANSNEYH
jgi:hypothetical protein